MCVFIFLLSNQLIYKGVTNMMNRTFSILLSFLFIATPVMAEDPNLLGNWGGLRTYLEERGVTPEVVLTMDFMRNVSGGIDQHGTALGNVDLTLEIDTEKAELWKNGTFFFYVLGNSRNNRLLTEIVGDFQASSNIEADEALKLYEAWYEHRFANGSVSFLAGLHDYNSEFNVLEYAGLFTNSSFGIEPDISQVGPSIFPITTSLTGRLKVNPSDNSYVMGAVYDGISGDPDHPTRTAVRLDDGDRIFAALEAGITNSEAGNSDYCKLAVGTWIHTARVELFDGSVNSENKGVYLIAEKTLFAENTSGEGLGAFFQLGFADSDLNQISSYWGAGINYTGLIPGRNQDITGLAVASARNGNSFMKFTKADGNDVEHTETAIELTYRAEVLPWLTLQPDIQYILNPGMDPSLDDALVAGVRMEVLF